MPLCQFALMPFSLTRAICRCHSADDADAITPPCCQPFDTLPLLRCRCHYAAMPCHFVTLIRCFLISDFRRHDAAAFAADIISADCFDFHAFAIALPPIFSLSHSYCFDACFRHDFRHYFHYSLPPPWLSLPFAAFLYFRGFSPPFCRLSILALFS